MGQYYNAYLEKKNRSDAYEVYAGSKLMEVALYSKSYMAYILSRLIDSPYLVAFIGDYANLKEDAYGPFNNEEYIIRYNRTWENDSYTKRRISDEILNDTAKEYAERLASSFVVNCTKKSFIDMEKYISTAWRDRYGQFIHPLAILCACGNGRGLGDYGVCSSSLMNKVGLWAFDEIIVRTSKEEIPWTYTEVTESVLFYEDGR